MEKKVIKISLVGVICVLLLIIAGIVITVVSLTGNKGEKNEENTNNSATQTQAADKDKSNNKENKTKEKSKNESKKESKKEVTEYKDSIIVDGKKQEVELKIYKSELGYKMAYDLNSFYIQHYEMDEYKSLLTDTIYVNISKKTGDFSKDTENLVKVASEATQNNSEYTVSQNIINGKNSIKETENDESGITKTNYYIDAGNGKEYFVVSAVCGKEIKDYTIAIVDKMVSTFEVI